jgi:hypothetical protein
MIPRASANINVGAAFSIDIGVGGFGELAREMRNLYKEAQRQGFRPQGDWNFSLNYFQTLPPRLRNSLANANKAVAVMFYHDVQGAWETQSQASSWQPLDADYLASKIRGRLDRRILIATGEALESLAWTGTDLSLEVGVTAVSEDGFAYMLAQEFGSLDGTLPARPLFGPVFDQNMERYLDVYTQATVTALNGKVYRDYARGVLA